MTQRVKPYTGRHRQARAALLRKALPWLIFMAVFAILVLIFPPRTTSAYDPSVAGQRPVEVPAAFVFEDYAAPEPKPTINATDTWLLTLPTLTYAGDFWITGYNPMDPSQCGKAADSPYIGIGANSQKIVPGEHVAMCSAYPFGTRVYIEGLGAYEVQDRGVGPGKIDVACATNAACYAITSTHPVRVWIIEED